MEAQEWMIAAGIRAKTAACDIHNINNLIIDLIQ
jgi:hypothetical protein